MGAELDIEPLDRCFGARVRGVELRSVDESEVAALRDAWVDHGLLIFSDQFLTPDEQNSFARHFGDLEFEATPISVSYTHLTLPTTYGV